MSKHDSVTRPTIDAGSRPVVPVECLCLNTQRAARALAQLFDHALRPLGITSGQFSLMMAISGPGSHTVGRTAEILAMDRTTLTAALKALRRRDLVSMSVNPEDKRSQLLALTPQGRKLLQRAKRIWRRMHDQVERELAEGEPDRLRQNLAILSGLRL